MPWLRAGLVPVLVPGLVVVLLLAIAAGLVPRLAARVIGDPQPVRAAPVTSPVIAPVTPQHGSGRAVPNGDGDPGPERRPAPVAPASPPPDRAGGHPLVYLTFDDGPDPRWTPQVLDLLRAHGARAVFFEIGQSAAAHPELVARVRAEGHLIGNHTWSHERLTGLRGPGFRAQLDRADAALGGRARCVRPPYGDTDDRVSRALRARGQQPVLWDVDPEDWSRPGVTRIVRRVLAQVRPGARILLHDGGGDRSQTVAALRVVLDRLEAGGYRFGQLPC